MRSNQERDGPHGGALRRCVSPQLPRRRLEKIRTGAGRTSQREEGGGAILAGARADVWWKNETEYDRGPQTEGSQRLLEDDEQKCQELQFELDAQRQVNADIMMQLQDVKGLYDVARSQVRPRVVNNGRQLHAGILCMCYPGQACSDQKMLARAAARRTKGARANQFKAGGSRSSGSSSSNGARSQELSSR